MGTYQLHAPSTQNRITNMLAFKFLATFTNTSNISMLMFLLLVVLRIPLE